MAETASATTDACLSFPAGRALVSVTGAARRPASTASSCCTAAAAKGVVAGVPVCPVTYVPGVPGDPGLTQLFGKFHLVDMLVKACLLRFGRHLQHLEVKSVV